VPAAVDPNAPNSNPEGAPSAESLEELRDKGNYVKGQPFKVHLDSIEPEAGPTTGDTYL